MSRRDLGWVGGVCEWGVGWVSRVGWRVMRVGWWVMGGNVRVEGGKTEL